MNMTTAAPTIRLTQAKIDGWREQLGRLLRPEIRTADDVLAALTALRRFLAGLKDLTRYQYNLKKALQNWWYAIGIVGDADSMIAFLQEVVAEQVDAMKAPKSSGASGVQAEERRKRAAQQIQETLTSIAAVGLSGWISKTYMSNPIEKDMEEYFRELESAIGNESEEVLFRFNYHGLNVAVDNDPNKPRSVPEMQALRGAIERSYALLRRRNLLRVWGGTLKVEPLAKAERSRRGNAAAAVYDLDTDEITLWDVSRDEVVTKYLTHEMGHRYWFRVATPEQRARYEDAFLAGRFQPVTPYAATHFEEAFAETFSAYVLGRDLTREQVETFKDVLAEKDRVTRAVWTEASAPPLWVGAASSEPDRDLAAAFDRLNAELWDGKLMRPQRFEWDDKKASKRGGNGVMSVELWVHPTKGLGAVGLLRASRLYRCDDDHFLDLIVHEMVHIEVAQRGPEDAQDSLKHGPRFRAAIDEIRARSRYNPPYEESDQLTSAKEVTRPVVIMWLMHDGKRFCLSMSDTTFRKNEAEIHRVLQTRKVRGLACGVIRSTAGLLAIKPLVKTIKAKPTMWVASDNDWKEIEQHATPLPGSSGSVTGSAGPLWVEAADNERHRESVAHFCDSILAYMKDAQTFLTNRWGDSMSSVEVEWFRRTMQRTVQTLYDTIRNMSREIYRTAVPTHGDERGDRQLDRMLSTLSVAASYLENAFDKGRDEQCLRHDVAHMRQRGLDRWLLETPEFEREHLPAKVIEQYGTFSALVDAIRRRALTQLTDPNVDPEGDPWEAVDVGRMRLVFLFGRAGFDIDSLRGGPTGVDLNRHDADLRAAIPRVLSAARQAEERLRRCGLGRLWYGLCFVGNDLLLTHLQLWFRAKKIFTEAAGTYSYDTDTIDLYRTNRNNDRAGYAAYLLRAPVEDLAQVLIHEIGHRCWFKHLDSAQRHEFEALLESGRVGHVTEYAKTNVKEAFAELFAYVVTQKVGDKDRSWVEEFRRLLGDAGMRVTASARPSQIRANQEDDRQARAQARRAWMTVRRFLEANADAIARAPRGAAVPNRAALQLAQDSDDGFVWLMDGSLLLYAPAAGLSDPTLWLRFGSADGRRHGGYTPQPGAAILTINALRAPDDPTYLDTRLRQDVFVHEYTHYLDVRRAPGALPERKHGEDADSTATEVLRRYFNDPLEQNAHYHDALAELERAILGRHGAALAPKLLTDSAQTFAAKMFEKLPAGMQEHLTPENRRRIMKRLAGFWQYYRENLMRVTASSRPNRTTLPVAILTDATKPTR